MTGRWMHPAAAVRFRSRAASLCLIWTALSRQSAPANPLIRHTTPGLETNRKGCIVADDEHGITSRTAYSPAATPLPAQLPLSSQWAQASALRLQWTSTSRIRTSNFCLLMRKRTCLTAGSLRLSKNFVFGQPLLKPRFRANTEEKNRALRAQFLPCIKSGYTPLTFYEFAPQILFYACCRSVKIKIILFLQTERTCLTAGSFLIR